MEAPLKPLKQRLSNERHGGGRSSPYSLPHSLPHSLPNSLQRRAVSTHESSWVLKSVQIVVQIVLLDTIRRAANLRMLSSANTSTTFQLSGRFSPDSEYSAAPGQNTLGRLFTFACAFFSGFFSNFVVLDLCILLMDLVDLLEFYEDLLITLETLTNNF